MSFDAVKKMLNTHEKGKIFLNYRKILVEWAKQCLFYTQQHNHNILFYRFNRPMDTHHKKDFMWESVYEGKKSYENFL